MKLHLNYAHVIYFLLIISIFFSACDKDSKSKTSLYHEYFPVKLGHWVIYDVDSIVYDDFYEEVDTFHYQIKEVVESKFTDNSGNKAFRLERYTRSQPNDKWNINNVWTVRRLASRAEKVEENLRYIKLVFPPKVNKTWDGNAYNIKPEQTYRITNVHQQKTINDMLLDSVVDVLQKEFTETLISKEYEIEMYAKNIGLVYKEYINLKKEIDGTITSGVKYKYKVVDYNDSSNH